MLLEMILCLSLIAPGAVIQDWLPLDMNSLPERIALSYALSLALFFPILYVGAISFTFYLASHLVLLISLGSVIYLLYSHIIEKPRMYSSLMNCREISGMVKTGILTAIGLLLVYALVLSTRPILDSDVAQFYLPIAREIARFNGFTYSTGYDFNILLKPIGASVLYAWTYALSGSIVAEVFRLLPLIPVMVMLTSVYSIAVEVTRSARIATLSLLIFSVIPFQDRLLLYNAYYPDVYYYPLIFTALLLLLKYSKNRKQSHLLLAGVSVGLAGLLKAQAIYFMIAVLVMIFFLESGRKWANSIVCFVTPFIILLPNLLIESIRRLGSSFALSGLQIETLPLFCFLGGFLVIAYLSLSRYGLLCAVSEKHSSLGRLVIRTAAFLIPLLLVSSLWYITNLLRFGSLLSTSTIDLPNYEWALDVLEMANPTQPIASLFNYLPYFAFMFVDPAVLGYVWSVVLFIGVAAFVKSRYEGSATLALISLLFASVVFSQVVYAIPAVGAPAYNPRDLLVLAPLLCISSSVGIVHLVEGGNDTSDRGRLLSMASLALVAFYGFLGYMHSVIMWFASIFAPTSLPTGILSGIASIFGLTLRETSLQLIAAERVAFPVTNMIPIALLSIAAGLPAFVLHSKRFLRRFSMQSTHLTRNPARNTGIRKNQILKSMIVLSVILVPRGFLFLHGGVISVSEYSLNSTYVGLQNLSDYEVEGILTYRAPDGLPYYLPESMIVDFRWPANIAHLKDILVLENPRDVAEGLRANGITHLLLNPSISDDIDSALNNTFSSLLANMTLSFEVQLFGGWVFHEIGPFSIERESFPLSWNISSRWTNSSYTLETNASGVHMSILPESETSRVTIFSHDLPKAPVDDFDLIQLNVSGSPNARLLVRIFFDDASALDVVYWIDPLEANTRIATLGPFSERSFRGDVFVGLTSSDGDSAQASLNEIAFLKLNHSA
jgi:hypothetical protein